ncbi:MAG TPA: ParB N-terminal domain-containing protein [Chitinivibrionales bacterium]|nr:ParB N-terminal domain-containing protein [Chitinivibrionales bacterium]
MSVTRRSQSPFQSEPEVLTLSRANRFEKISLRNIFLPKDLHDETALSRQLPAAQLLNPILVSKSDSGTYEILDGCKRFKTMKQKKIKERICGILPSLDTRQKGLVRVLLNRGRALSMKEQFLFYSWLTTSAGIKEKDDLRRFLDIPRNQMNDLDELLASPGDVRDAVFENRLHAANAAEFRLLSGKDRKKFLELFAGLDLSFQTEREFVQWMSEIVRNQNSGIKDFSGFAEIAFIKKNGAINAPQKIQRINSYLRGLRFPRYENARRKWEGLAASVNPDPSKVSFMASPYFEKNRLEVRLVFSKPQEAAGILKKLCDIPESAWSSLISPHEL